jgi:hypothetical protein
MMRIEERWGMLYRIEIKNIILQKKKKVDEWQIKKTHNCTPFTMIPKSLPKVAPTTIDGMNMPAGTYNGSIKMAYLTAK